jgi:predicted SAM-dependent methyltransferase
VTIKKYLRDNKVPKLQVGCGPNYMKRWLNADIVSGDIYFNAKRKFPFKNNTFDFIFCEHFIEHIPLNTGQNFLTECHRILKKDGVIRITTPDLEKVIEIYHNPSKGSELLAKAVYGKEVSACELINSYWNHWGHKLIYDENLVKLLLNKAGFTEVTFCESKKSSHRELANLEMHDELVDETLSAEAKK